MGSIFSKALVYLGLVDEDPANADPLLDDDNPGAVTRRGDAGRRSANRYQNEEWDDSEPDFRRRDPRRPEDRRIEPISRVEGRRVEPPTVVRSGGYRSGDHDPSPVRAVRPVDVQADILLVEEFGDAKILADRVRDRVPVVLDLRRTDPDLVRRVIDFASGLIYALDGTMSKVGEGVVAVMPPRVILSREERRRLERLGVYELADED
ncbi:MAG TPA: cell division protein SepF [Acidimicrobiia bacterium]|jgi:cell division inhibitor SepF